MELEDEIFSSYQNDSSAYSQKVGLSEKAGEYLSVLNDEQKEAVLHQGKSLLILAGAGSGKTRVITTKIAYLIGERNVEPYSILAVTFTKKAANEMHERAVALDSRAESCQIRTFHSFGAWFLRMYAEQAGVAPSFTVYDDDDMVTLVSKANPSLTRAQASKFAHYISLCKDYCILPGDNNISQIVSDSDFVEVYENYQKRLRETGNVDFGDLILLPYLVLKTHPEVKERINRRFKVIMVDEYQDSNVAQFNLLKSLAGPDTYVCVVGDDDQSIYKFRGAEIQNILTFKDSFPDTQIIRLESNYRSKAEILAVADDVVKNNEGRLGKTLRAERGAGKKPVLIFLPTQDEEAAFCADMVLQTHEAGVPYSDWAFLYRTNAQSLTFESEFLHRKIPYAVVGSLKFYEREEIKDMLACLSLLANGRDEIAFRRIVNKPARGIGETSVDKIVNAYRSQFVNPQPDGEGKTPAAQDYIHCARQCARENAGLLTKKGREGLLKFCEMFEELQKILDENSTRKEENLAAPKDVREPHIIDKLSVLVEQVAEKSGLKEYHQSQDEISGTQRVANIQELANSAVLYECTMDGLLEFLDHIELDRTLDTETDTDNDRVTLITLHNTKGLEFNRVVMTGMEYGIFPRPEKSGDDLEEERRLCYVGITRARNELYMTCCQSRRMYGRLEYMSPSPFLKEIDRDHIKILGHEPSSFSSSAFHGGDYGSLGLSHPDMESDPIRKKYCKGTRVYHDDWGYGVINYSTLTEEGEYIVSVGFESGVTKKFLPKYQQNQLMVVKE